MARPLLSAAARAALAAVDLEPVGPVTGVVVSHLSWSSASCGGYRNSGNDTLITPVVVVSNAYPGQGGQQSSGYTDYLQARYRSYDTALVRMTAQARARGADGVLGITLAWTKVDRGADALTAIGTAVRHRSAQPAAGTVRPFRTDLTAQDTARALLSGWTPLTLSIGLAVAVKHEDRTMQRQTSWLRGPGNTEVAGLTNVLAKARRAARHALTARAEAQLDQQFRVAPERPPGTPIRPDDAPPVTQVVVSRRELHTGRSECAGGRDHLAEALLIGTLLRHDGRSRRPDERRPSLSILPLDGRPAASRDGRAGAAVRSPARRGDGSTDHEQPPAGRGRAGAPAG
jgi:uncharacterized protein YbjQ (UPF0145 family)